MQMGFLNNEANVAVSHHNDSIWAESVIRIPFLSLFIWYTPFSLVLEW